jgi:hypothetical protein
MRSKRCHLRPEGFIRRGALTSIVSARCRRCGRKRPDSLPPGRRRDPAPTFAVLPKRACSMYGPFVAGRARPAPPAAVQKKDPAQARVRWSRSAVAREHQAEAGRPSKASCRSRTGLIADSLFQHPKRPDTPEGNLAHPARVAEEARAGVLSFSSRPSLALVLGGGQAPLSQIPRP